MNHQALSSFIWSVADLLRGDYRQSEYGRVILPFTVLRRLDCVLESTKAAVLAEFDTKSKAGLNPEPFLLRKAGQSFYNTSPLDLVKLLGDQDHIRQNLYAYVQAFSPAARDIFERFDFYTLIERLAKNNLLYLVTEKFANIDLHPNVVDNASMGVVFEELIRKFAEISNETAGEHFTPREVIRLMVNLLFIEDDDVLTPGGAVVRTIYDPTAGTGGMLSTAGEYLSEHNPQARLTMFGQELNDESYAICKADMLIKGQPVENIVAGNTLSDDGHSRRKFDYMLSNPPFGVEWKKVEKAVRQEHESRGFDGRFGPGLPRVSDGSMLFLMHLLSKMAPVVNGEGGSRFGIVLNGSPLFTGGAGSGESEIRRYVLENDLVEAIVGLPTDMFYNTGIATYVWILSNKKPEARKGYVQLIDASGFWQKMRKSLGSKRKEMSDGHIATVTRLFGDFIEAERVTVLDSMGQELGQWVVPAGAAMPDMPSDGNLKRAPISRILRNEDFGFTTITVERPLLCKDGDEAGKPVLGVKGKQKGKLQPDSALRDTENVPLTENIQTYFEREVLPHAPDAWIDHEKSKVGYEIPFNRHFYVFEPQRSLHAIDEELKTVSANVMKMLEELERRQAAISHAVTKGLNPNTPMKASGIAWLGVVPEHWNVTRLKFVATVQTGIAKGKDIVGKTTILVPYLRVANVQDGFLALENVASIEIEADQLDRYRLRAGDVLMNEGGDFDKLGRGAIWRDEIPDCIHQNHVFAVRPHSITSEWLNCITSSQYAQFYFMGRSKQSTNLASISSTNIMELPVLLPPEEEQRAILHFIGDEIDKIDTLKALSERAITLLKERRGAIIAAAVTGQVDVRGTAIQEGQVRETISA
ncbi:type I restriction enzyme M protein [Duganella sp. HSC-15S17]|uniref:site-specific DNA-methyltransferase (adenine-specific) n=2 Tax=Duganella violaceipulchra TaxID=2849652 RepID=A0ABT1GRK0_9BURK|nr:type I restriction enzyme M protein [Duganella violaceicalia]